MRAALVSVYTAAAKPQPSYTNTLTPYVTVVKALDLMQLRSAITGVE